MILSANVVSGAFLACQKRKNTVCIPVCHVWLSSARMILCIVFSTHDKPVPSYSNTHSRAVRQAYLQLRRGEVRSETLKFGVLLFGNLLLFDLK